MLTGFVYKAEFSIRTSTEKRPPLMKIADSGLRQRYDGSTCLVYDSLRIETYSSAINTYHREFLSKWSGAGILERNNNPSRPVDKSENR